MKYNPNPSRSGRELPPFDDLSQRDVVGFMQRYFGYQVRDARLAQAVLDDDRAMAIVREAYRKAQQEGHTKADQTGLTEKLEARVKQLTEAGQRSGRDSYYQRY